MESVPIYNSAMYEFRSVNHRVILTYSILIGLTPLIPIPFLDDIVKSEFQRRMVRQIAGLRGQAPTQAQVETLLKEDFMRGCIGGCAYALLYIPLRELLSKVFFIVEWQRAFNLVSTSYYTGFLIDCALMDGYRLDLPVESTAQARLLREAVDRTRQNADLELIQDLVRKYLRPGLLLRGAWQIIRASVSRFPRILSALTGAILQGVRSAPGMAWKGISNFPRRVRHNFILRVQVLLGRERAPELVFAERAAQKIQASLMNMPSDHFDALHQRLQAELNFRQRQGTALDAANP